MIYNYIFVIKMLISIYNYFVTKKSYIFVPLNNKPHIMKPTEHQNKALMRLIDNFKLDTTTLQTLNGYAGTGKSTIIPLLLSRYNKQRALLLAPTNRAVLVLKSKMEAFGGGLTFDCSTIHSALYAPPDKDGNFYFKEVIDSNRLVIVDESSMVSLQLYKDLLKKYQKSNFVFVGDSFQLEPIGDASPIFDLDTTTLTEVIRYDSGILQTANNLRVSPTPTVKINDDVVLMDKSLTALKHYVVGLFNGIDSVLITATNQARVSYNEAIRKALGKSPMLDDDVMMCVSNTGRYANGETFLLDNAVFVKTLTISVNKTNILIHIYDKEEQRYLIVPKLLSSSLHPAEIIKSLDTQGEVFAIFGEDRYNPHRKSIERVNICTWGYAISAHKSQGGQWDNVYIDFNYCAPSWNPNRWLYTAITRAAKKVYLLPSNNYNVQE